MSSDNVVIETDFGKGGTLKVVRIVEPDDWNMYNVTTYDVIVDGVVRHPKCKPEDVMRALGSYIQSFSHALQK